ncbi:MAG: hypothetical protein ACOCVM_03730 [Desulfovibrionaceae bacterium]
MLAPPACGLKPRLYERLGEDPAALWRSFRDSGQSVRPGRPVKLSASLYYFGKRRKNRTTISLWGRQGEVMRLDVRAGVGSLVSAWLERPDYFLAYFPGEKTAYASRTPLAGQAALGLPFPFTLLDLAAVAGGRLDALLPQAYDRAEETVNGVRYFFEDGAVSSLSLDKQGRLQAVQGREPWPYELELGDYPEEDDGFARKLSLRMDEASALLRVKSLEHRVEPWPEGAVGLDLPEGTRIMWIDESALEAEPEF